MKFHLLHNCLLDKMKNEIIIFLLAALQFQSSISQLYRECTETNYIFSVTGSEQMTEQFFFFPTEECY